MKSLVVIGCSLMALACAEQREDPTSLPASAGPTVNAFIEGGRISAALGAPLAESGNDLDTNAGDDQTRGTVEEGLGSGGGDGDTQQLMAASALTNPECVSSAWEGLTITVTYNQCMDEDGTTIHGGLSLGVTLVPLRFSIQFDQLAVDATTYNGSFSIGFSGPQGNRTTKIDADLSIASSATSKSVQLEQMSLTVTEASLVLDGAGGFSDSQTSVSFDATAVTVATGDCLPTSGTLAYDDGTFDVVIGFLATTPTTGEVSVSSGAFQTTVALLPPCT